ncbi:hypothetical protein PT282_07225 [Bifidobacterium sp. ESL0763]|uniref:hypothetical protein n=1 Tax=Bifidobacterium sp. ESL0763 TaxID=2983227 RepID=UPI0023F8BAF3|nr:hypothetical protein [Bifidobacterium sp. ESL0763]MDF7664447.1 hypothetical protein [Bifidobacterium sp. ESL0763]
MKKHKELEILAERAESERRCFFGATDSQRKALRRRRKAGELVSPYMNMYARTHYWRQLSPPERMLHLIRALAMRHPRWVFAGSSAALVWGFDCPWSMFADGKVTVANEGSASHSKCSRLEYRGVSWLRVGKHGGIRVTDPARTVVDCGMRYSFAQGLAVADSAMRLGLVHGDDVVKACRGLHHVKPKVGRLVRYANPLSENGGESLCRAVIIESRFMLPQLQRVFVDPADVSGVYRADFSWHFRDGRVVVLEFDGMRKYDDTDMTGNRSTREVVHAERERESALMRAGVTDILRTDYREVRNRAPLIAKLANAGIPRFAP